MAGAARLPLLHGLHGYIGVVGGRPEDGIVAVGASVGPEPQMEGMAEDHGAEGGDVDGDLFGHMAAGARRQAEGALAVVAGAARRPLLHGFHGHRRCLVADREERVVTEGAVVAQGLEVDRVAEGDRTRGLGGKGDDLVVTGKENDWKKQKHYGRNKQAFHGSSRAREE